MAVNGQTACSVRISTVKFKARTIFMVITLYCCVYLLRHAQTFHSNYVTFSKLCFADAAFLLPSAVILDTFGPTLSQESKVLLYPISKLASW